MSMEANLAWYDRERRVLAKLRGEAAAVLARMRSESDGEAYREATRRQLALDAEQDRLIAARNSGVPYRVRQFTRLGSTEAARSEPLLWDAQSEVEFDDLSPREEVSRGND